MARITDRKDWFDLWLSDKRATLATMIENLASDIRAGYDYYGVTVTRQRKEIDLYAFKMDEQILDLAYKSDEDCNRWCFYDMKKRGVLSGSDLPF